MSSKWAKPYEAQKWEHIIKFNLEGKEEIIADNFEDTVDIRMEGI